MRFPLKTKNRFVTLLLAATMVMAVSVAVPKVAFAAPDAGASQEEAGNGLAEGGSGLRIPIDQSDVKLSEDIIQDRTFAETVIAIVNYAIGFLGLVATVVFIAGGVLMIISGGNEENVTKGRKMMTYAAIGIVVIILSYSAVRFIAGAGEKATPSAPSPAGPQTPSQPPDQNGAGSQQTTPAFQDQIDKLDERMDGMEKKVSELGDAIKALPKETREQVDKVIRNIDVKNPAALKDAKESVKKLLEEAKDPKVQETLQKLLDNLNDLSYLRDELTALRETMPESSTTIKMYDEVSTALDELIEDPGNRLKFKRFDEKYRSLKEMIRKFPVVTAQILAVPAQGNVPLTVTLDGLGSKDPTGGTISQYKWTFLDSKGSEVSLGSDPVVVYTFKESNTYSVKLRASTSNTDKEGYKTAADGVAFVRVTVRPAATQVRLRINGKKATDVYHATLQEAEAGLSLDPSGSTPTLGRMIEKYEWSFGDGATETRSSPIAVVHSYPKPGEYSLRLVTTDNQKEQDSLLIKISVKSVAAEINISPEEGDVNTEFYFVGVDSRSDDGVIDKYEWTITDSRQNVIKGSDKQQFRHRFTKPGEYHIVLLVTDTNKKQDKVIKTLKIDSRAPIASFDWSVSQENHPNRVRFDAANSYDLDEGDKITYSWDFDNDSIYDVIDSAEPNTQFEYKKVGEFKAKLQVKDQFGGMGTVEKVVHIKSVLSADMEADHRVARVGEELAFTAKSDAAVAYSWDFGDNETGNSEKPEITHTYNKKGKYTVRMTFFDKEDNENATSLTILIGEGERPLASIGYTVNGHLVEPVADLCGSGKPGLEVYRSDTIHFSGQESINTDGSSRMLLYEWELGDGEKSSRKEFTHRYSDLNVASECTAVRLVVKDQVKGAVSEDDIVYFRVVNQLPKLTDFVVQPPREGELITPVKIQLRAVMPKDIDGNIKKYRWWYYREGRQEERLGLHNTSSGTTEVVVTATGEPDVVETYHFALEMVDSDNGVYNTEERFGELSMLKIKNGPNLSPVADFRMDKTTIKVGDSASFISASYDPQGDILGSSDFKWDFDGDGNFDDTSSGPQVSRKYNTPGEYQVRLKVTHRGLSSSATHPIFVEPTQQLPQAAFTYQIDDSEVTFDAGTSRYDDSLPDKTLRYEWDFDTRQDADGNGTKDDDVEATDKVAKHVYPDKGIYQVRLKLKDAQGQEGVVVREVNLAQSAVQREESTYKSLRIKAGNQPLTTLDVTVAPMQLLRNETAEITASVTNADNEPYAGDVYFEITEGAGAVSPSPARADGSKAVSIFTASDKGKVKIRVRATNAMYGDLSEEVELNVR